MPPGIIIRKFEVRDRGAVRKIVHDTALMGESAAIFFQGEEVLSDAFSLYFTDYEPESCFVAENNAEVTGYLIGAKSKSRAEAVFARRIAAPLLLKALRQGIFLKPKNLIFILGCLKDLLINGMRTPDFNRRFPATLHVNIKNGFRGQDTGSRLIAAYLDYLRKEKIPGVHLATMSEGGANFFLSQGFELLYKGRRSYFRQVLKRDVPLFIFGRRL